MKALKSSSQDLGTLFNHTITIEHIAEPLASFDLDADIAVVRAFMQAKGYDVVGIRKDGLVAGYAAQVDLTSGTLAEHYRDCPLQNQLPASAPLAQVLEKLKQDPPCVFVTTFGRVSGIVTRGDLEKALFRLWVFGLLTLFEMQLLRLIKGRYPGDTWVEWCQANGLGRRIKEARGCFARRKASGVEIDLADCLYLEDRLKIVLHTSGLRSALGLGRDTDAEEFAKQINDLRNDIAHGFDIIAPRWPAIIDFVASIADKLERCEGIELPAAEPIPVP